MKHVLNITRFNITWLLLDCDSGRNRNVTLYRFWIISGLGAPSSSEKLLSCLSLFYFWLDLIVFLASLPSSVFFCSLVFVEWQRTIFFHGWWLFFHHHVCEAPIKLDQLRARNGGVHERAVTDPPSDTPLGFNRLIWLKYSGFLHMALGALGGTREDFFLQVPPYVTA